MKCEQCGFNVDALPEGGGEYLCPNCGYCMRKGAPAAPRDGTPVPTDTASGTATHLKIARTVNVGFGDFASVLAATDASKIVPTDTKQGGMERTRTASASTLTVEAPDDDDETLTPLTVYDEDDEYARIQADIAARQQALDAHAAELDLHGARPFFCVQHPHPKGTLFSYWGKGAEDGGQLTEFLKDYPNAVSFSGHSHMGLTDDRAVWQGAFTAVNTCTLLQISTPYGGEWQCVNSRRKDTSQARHMGATSRRGRQGMVMDVWPDRLEIERREFALGEVAGPVRTVPVPVLN